jgi:hypothetical protein
MIMSYADVYYYTLRQISRQKIVNDLNANANTLGITAHIRGMTICSINKEALDYARLEWPKYYGEETHNGFQHSWETLLRKYMHRPSYFDIAIWQNLGEQPVLQALALGQPSNGKRQLNLNWIERSFAPTYLRCGALLPILGCAEEYAKLIDATKVVIKDAVDPSVYGRYGYHPVRLPHGGGVHPVKEL